MSTTISIDAPEVTYVSSSDTGATNGTNTFQITFDQSISTLGTVIMFEYKLQDITINHPDLSGVSGGFITLENAILQSGVTNQYIVSIPAEENVWNIDVAKNVQFRVYVGHKTPGLLQDIVVTEWSAAIDVHNPPYAPHIEMGYYNPRDPSVTPSDDDLFILLDTGVDVNGVAVNDYDYDNIQFIACYYFKNVNGDTVWEVSQPISAEQVTMGTSTFYRITVGMSGEVSTTAGEKQVYCSIHAVYSWTDGNGYKYNAISEMSNSLEAIAGSDDVQPNIVQTGYNVYVDRIDQTINVGWNAPGSSALPFYAIDGYNLYISTDNFATPGTLVNSTQMDSAINSTIVDVSSYLAESVSFKIGAVYANSSLGEELSDPSDPINIFSYPDAPKDLSIHATSVTVGTPDLLNITIKFKNPDEPGEGTDTTSYRYDVTIGGNNSFTPASGSLTYNDQTAEYTIVYEDLDVALIGEISVVLRMDHPNDSLSATLTSESSDAYYFSASLVLDALVYNVYAANAQTIAMEWNDIVVGSSGWSVTEYEIYDGSVDPDGTSSVNTYNYVIVDDVGLYVVAKMAHISGATFDVQSNQQNINYFSFSQNPSIILNWAVADEASNKMDMSMIVDPYNINYGINDGAVDFVIQVYDNTSTMIAEEIVTITVNNTHASFNVNFDAIDLSSAGTISAFTRVQDNNSLDNDKSWSDNSISFNSTALPKFINTTLTGNVIRGDIITNVLLQPTAAVVFPTGSGLLETVGIYFDGTTTNPDGFEVTTIPSGPSDRQGPNYEYIYSYELTNGTDAVGGINRAAAIIIASNTAGLGSVSRAF